jgi:UDP-N-acetylglucosamine--dolichyl-phosphate N-acetylglucosaminephosphotransferase
MESLLFVSIFFGILVTLISLPFWIKRAKKVGITGKDINKLPHEEPVAEAGGICVIIGFIIGVLVYVAIKTFYFKTYEFTLEIFSLMLVTTIISFMGFSDDILGWKIGLNKTVRIFFLIFASFPLIVINAAEIGGNPTTLGFVYPIFVIALGIVATSATFNFLAGYNGLESSQGMLIIFALSIVTYLTSNEWLSVIGLIMTGCLLMLYLFNKHPAQVFPGNVLTYPVGALIGLIAILGHIELIAIFFFIPYILETLLKIRGKLKKESFAKVNSDGSLSLLYDKIYGLEHLSILLLKKIKPSKKVYEKDVVYLINIFQIIIILLGFLIFKINPLDVFAKAF